MSETDASRDDSTMPRDEAQRLANAGALKDELQRCGAELQAAGLPSGGLSLIGLFEDVLIDQEIDEFVTSVRGAREDDAPRDVDMAGWATWRPVENWLE